MTCDGRDSAITYAFQAVHCAMLIRNCLHRKRGNENPLCGDTCDTAEGPIPKRFIRSCIQTVDITPIYKMHTHTYYISDWDNQCFCCVCFLIILFFLNVATHCKYLFRAGIERPTCSAAVIRSDTASTVHTIYCWWTNSQVGGRYSDSRGYAWFWLRLAQLIVTPVLWPGPARLWVNQKIRIHLGN